MLCLNIREKLYFCEAIYSTDKEMNRYNVVEIEPCGDYKLRVTFADGKCNVVDFEPYFIKRPHPQYDQYHDRLVLFRGRGCCGDEGKGRRVHHPRRYHQ